MLSFQSIITISISLLLSIAAMATDGKNELILQFSQEYGVHYSHTIAPKETIYSISKQAGVSVNQIYQINNLKKTDIISIGQSIIVPVNNESISSTKVPGSVRKVMYQVQKKDNLFQIAKRYFNQEVDAVVSRNNLPNLTLSPGQLLHIGWMKVNNTSISGTSSDYASTPSSTSMKAPVVPMASSNASKTTTSVASQGTPNAAKASTSQSAESSYRIVQHTKLPNQTTDPSTNQTSTSGNLNNAKSNTATTNNNSGPKTSSRVDSEVDSHISPQTATSTVKKVIVNQSTSTPTTQAIAKEADSSATSTSATSPSKPASSPGTIVIRSEAASPELSFLTDPNLLSDKGMAIWDREDNEPLNLYVLHQSAKVNSYMKIINPMIGRVVIAKVIGRLPDNVYGADVKMVVSTAVAKSLGVMDSRFLTEMKFVK